MHIAGIIAEYNPFHSGHQYHLQQTRQLTGADYLVAVISGNFVQRGEPAIFDKSIRTHMALSGGADVVLELPAPFACGSAEDFAMGAVSLLDKLGVITHLSFGSECGSLIPLGQAAQIALKEPPVYQQTIKQALRQGMSYPQARTAALSASGLNKETASLIEKPNNLLGIEYLKALYAQNSSIQPLTVPRKGSSYHEKDLEKGKFPSASALRRAIIDSVPACSISSGWLPSGFEQFYSPDSCFPLCADDISSILNYQILLSQNSLVDFSDMSPELANRLHRQALTPLSFTRRIESLKTRQYTYTRISRALLHLLLNIRREEMDAYRKAGYSSYARILGFKKEAAPLLHQIKAHSSIPLISKAADAEKQLDTDAQRLWEKDIFCSQVYSAALQQKYNILPPDEFRRQLIIL